MKPNTTDALRLAAADVTTRRRDAEVGLLAAVATCGRWTVALARRTGVTAAHFADDDTLAIWTAMEFAADSGQVVDPKGVVLLCRTALKHAGYWRPDDDRSFIGGMEWGPGPIARLFTSMTPTAAEEAVPALAADLLALVAEWDALCRRAWAEGTVAA